MESASEILLYKLIVLPPCRPLYRGYIFLMFWTSRSFCIPFGGPDGSSFVMFFFIYIYNEPLVYIMLLFITHLFSLFVYVYIGPHRWPISFDTVLLCPPPPFFHYMYRQCCTYKALQGLFTALLSIVPSLFSENIQ